MSAQQATNAAQFYKPYPKQIEFFEAGARCTQRMLLGGNRVGKTYSGSMETSYHLTGRYPDWWKGHRFTHPIDAWAASNTTQSTRDVLQYAYLGDVSITDINGSGGRKAYGCGSIPRDAIIEWSRARGGANDSVDIVKVRHVSGGVSTIGFKSYEQGRAKFQGAAKHWIHLDEEPDDQRIYNECVMRLAGEAVQGKLIITMTPLLGMTDVCLKFLQNDGGNLYNIQIGWQDVPHLSNAERDDLLSSMLPHEKEAREKGIPALGSGRVYTATEEQFVVDPFKLPDHWRFAYGMDFGWNNTAALFGALDPDSDTWYIYDEYKLGEKEPFYHSSVLKQKGATWMAGVCDPAGQSSGQKDGESLIDLYTNDGLNLYLANNSVEAGLMEVLQRLHSGRLKVFSNNQKLISEYRTYARDDKGKIIKKNDHLLDAMRYLIMSGQSYAKQKPLEKRPLYDFFANKLKQTSGWAL